MGRRCVAKEEEESRTVSGVSSSSRLDGGRPNGAGEGWRERLCNSACEVQNAGEVAGRHANQANLGALKAGLGLFGRPQRTLFRKGVRTLRGE